MPLAKRRIPVDVVHQCRFALTPIGPMPALRDRHIHERRHFRLRSRLFVILRVCAPVLLFAGLFWVVDLGTGFALLFGADGIPVLVALGLVQVQIVLAALRWRLTAASIGQSIGLARAITEYYGASLLNLVLPGGVSGDVVRVARNREVGVGASAWERPAQAVVLERASGQIAFALVAAAGVGLWTLQPGAGVPAIASEGLRNVVLAGLLMVAVLCVLAFAARRFAGGFVSRFAAAIRLAFLRPRDAALQLVLSLAVVAAYLAAFAAVSRAIGAPLGLTETLLLVPPVLLTMVLPVSVGGWGVREVAAAALWPLAGFTATEGVAASALYGIVATVGALPGVFSFDFPLVRLFRKRQTSDQD
ncbi:lysylphosphatidylglycerol synthase transmembrane domain-containing protein [Fulvimarina sp. 2208YS6-2-32]|uniref:Lysylphosphatidylglycerol synthase transmembrane domain-containing protein n=1 Tax=Fulvimarina uroteuthidis TaxID=3098149 RepID=A0ABU5I1Y2_9HYPH|nr:lysylphosphatidylglycerol synthase transmembrane domain-containing protein [Fulvimarina sp. 2208YS6-2-32]MDY8109379.1 lysylphosphatidylglycerol synthase transmembrane domain-containing protein [Fulvimarina sp. 2208YS6-2-32]